MVETVLLSSGGWYSEESSGQKLVLEAESCRSFVPQESFQINYLEIPNTGTPGGRILSCSRGRGHGQAEISGESLVGPFGSGGLSWEGLSESQAFQRSPRLGFPSRSLSCCSSTRGRALRAEFGYFGREL